jgi:hypothetical protein
LGCNWKEPLSQAHKTCLLKWFTQPILNYEPLFNGQGFYKNCEIYIVNLTPFVLLLLQKLLFENLKIEHRRMVIGILQKNEAIFFKHLMSNICLWLYVITLI